MVKIISLFAFANCFELRCEPKQLMPLYYKICPCSSHLPDPGLTGDVNFSHCSYETFISTASPGAERQVGIKPLLCEIRKN